MSNSTIIAVDPGMSGGIAIHDTISQTCSPMPSTDTAIDQELFLCIGGLSPKEGATWPVRLVIEKPPTFMPGQFGGSIVKLYGNYRFIVGLATAYGIRVEEVTPQKWQKALGLHRPRNMTGPEWKRRLRDKATKLFPAQKPTLQTCDALLILEYAMKTTGEK